MSDTRNSGWRCAWIMLTREARSCVQTQCCAGGHQRDSPLATNKRFLANALPDAVLRYRSKSIAAASVSNAPYHSNLYGFIALVERFPPQL
jgi:hypothetical protein